MSFRSDRGTSDRCCDPLSGLRSAVDAVIDQDPGALTDEELRVDVLRLRRQMDRLEAAFAERTSAANRRAVGLVDGHQSTPAWVAWKTGMPRGAVARVLRTAESASSSPPRT